MPILSAIPKDKKHQKAQEFIENHFPVWIDFLAKRDLLKVLVAQQPIEEDEFVLNPSIQNLNSTLKGVSGVFACGYLNGVYTDKDLFFMTMDQAQLFCSTVGAKATMTSPTD